MFPVRDRGTLMTKGMKIYAAFLLLVLGIILVNWLWVPGNVRAINNQLADDPYLASYPYQFRVLRIEGNTAVVSTPRSAAVPVPQMIGAIDPQLANASVSSDAYLTAQQELADHQAHAAAAITATPGISRILWELDRSWLRANGIQWPE